MRRHIVNEPEQMVEEALEGFASAHSSLVAFDSDRGVITRARPARDKVGLVSGGGSGHEPLHAGFVGQGMLDVAVPGAIFASPTALQLHEGTRAADNGAGVLHIVKNYTGDVLNFTIAGELAADEGTNVATVIVDDDLATDTQSGEDGEPGRRGTAGVIAVEKVCGAAAEAGASLDEVEKLGRRVADRARTMSLALGAGTHPDDSEPAFRLDANEVEFGVGIHGERGRERVPFAPADQLTSLLVEPLLSALEPAPGTEVIAIVNGLGSTYPMELYVATRALTRLLNEKAVNIARSLVGTLVSSLDMHGLSITLVPADEEILRLWDAPVRTPALTW